MIGLRVVLVWSALVVSVTAQSTFSMDAEMEGATPSSKSALSMRLAGTSPGDTIEVEVSFGNYPTQFVRVDWAYDVEGHIGKEESVFSPTYRPTAVARYRGLSDRIFVAGWKERTAQLVIEEWSFGSGALSVSYNGQGQEIVTFTPPTRIVRTVFESANDSMGPAWGIACYPEADELLVLERSSTGDTHINALSLSAQTMTALYVPPGHQVASLRSIWSSDSIPNGRIVTASERAPFASSPGGYQSPVFLILDVDHDGLIDAAFSTTLADKLDNFDGPWNYDG